jgi:CRP-like cAMP-binding protein
VHPAPLPILDGHLESERVAVERAHPVEVTGDELYLEDCDRRIHPAVVTQVASFHRIEPTVRHQLAAVWELARIEMLAGLPGDTLERLAGRMERRQLQPGDAIYESQDEQGRFTVVISGMLRTNGGQIVRPGEALGGLTLFGEPVQAIVPSVVATCDSATFDELVRPRLVD